MEGKHLFNILKKVVHLGRTGGVPTIWRALHRRLRPTAWTKYDGMAASQVAILSYTSHELI